MKVEIHTGSFRIAVHQLYNNIPHSAFTCSHSTRERSEQCVKSVQKLNYNHFQNILRLLDVLPRFPFTTSETMGDYYL